MLHPLALLHPLVMRHLLPCYTPTMLHPLPCYCHATPPNQGRINYLSFTALLKLDEVAQAQAEKAEGSSAAAAGQGEL